MFIIYWMDEINGYTWGVNKQDRREFVQISEQVSAMSRGWA